MAEENTITTVFKADISQFSASTQQLNQYVRNVNSQFEAATAGMGRWSDNTEGLQAKIQQLNGTLEADKRKLADLTAQYKKMEDAGEGNSYQAKQLQIAINKQIATIKKTEKQTDDYTAALKELEDAGVKTKKELQDLTDAQNKQGESAGSVAGKLAKGLGKGIAAVGGAAVGAVTGFLALGESTRDFRKEQAQLETAFETSGHSVETMRNTYADFNAVLGDTSKTTEAMQQLAQFTKSEQELADYTNILTGVFATYGEALSTEGLAEGINHTIKLGEVQGTLADALEWGGVSVEEFNAQLEKCSTEEERNALIQEKLNGLYGEAAEHYKENNKDILEAEKAQTRLTQTMADLGAVAEPIMTMLKNTLADLMEAIKPFVQLIGEGLRGAFDGSADGAQKFAEGLSGIVNTLLTKISEMLPVAIEFLMQLIPTLISTLASSLPSIIQTLSDGFVQIVNALAAMTPQLLPVIIDAVLSCAETILDNLDVIIDAGLNLIIALADGIIGALPKLIDKIPVIISKVYSAFVNNYPKILKTGIELVLKLAAGLVQAIPDLVSKIPELIKNMVSTFINDGVPKMLEVGKDLIKGVWDGIKSMGKWLWDKVKGFFSGITDKIKKFFGIESPSKLFKKEIGANLALGIGDGFVDEMGDVEKSMQKSMAKLTPALQIESPNLPSISSNANWVDRLAELINGTQGEIVNNYNFDYKFERVQTSRLALHQAELATRRIVGGRV